MQKQTQMNDNGLNLELYFQEVGQNDDKRYILVRMPEGLSQIKIMEGRNGNILALQGDKEVVESVVSINGVGIRKGEYDDAHWIYSKKQEWSRILDIGYLKKSELKKLVGGK